MPLLKHAPKEFVHTHKKKGIGTVESKSNLLMNYFLLQSNTCCIQLAHTSIPSGQASQQLLAQELLDNTRFGEISYLRIA